MQLSEIKLRHRETLVDLTYQTLLNRPPDPEGKQTFLNKLVKGEMLTLIILDFINSEEYKEKKYLLSQSLVLSSQAVFEVDIAERNMLDREYQAGKVRTEGQLKINDLIKIANEL
jgi:hypothetical protein